MPERKEPRPVPQWIRRRQAKHRQIIRKDRVMTAMSP